MTDSASASAPQVTRMARETAEGPTVVARQLAANAAACAELARRLNARPPVTVVTCARGSSDHAATFGKYLIETRMGIPVASAAPSIASVYRKPMRLHGMLYIGISQSGRSPDIVASIEQARACGALVVALVNDTSSPMATAAEICLPLLAGPERSVAATKSFIASLSALAQVVSLWADDTSLAAGLERLPEWLSAAQAQDWRTAVPALTEAEDVLVIGRGIGLSVAQEAALKLKETASLHAEAFSSAEVRHGPLAILRPDLPFLAFSQHDETREGMAELITDLRGKGSRVFAAEAGEPVPDRLPVPSGLHPALAPIAMIQSFYVLAEMVALARGKDPDRPQYLSKITQTR